MPAVSFGDCDLDLETGELRRRGAVVALERQPAVVLLMLVSRAGRLVPRSDLKAALWPGNVHVDFDGGLNYCIRQLRAALDDDARRPRFLETVPRQGYRFIAALERTPTVAPRKAPAWTPVRTFRAAAALALTVILGAGLWESRLSASGHHRHHDSAVRIARAVHNFVF
jgi:DNA-binding winged helix-turn-helix (wHTH) protein